MEITAKKLVDVREAGLERMALAADQLGRTAGLVKLICGIVNNAAYMLTLVGLGPIPMVRHDMPW